MSESLCAGIIFVGCIITLLILVIWLGCGYVKWKDKTCNVSCPITNETFIVQNNKQEPEWVRKEVARRISTLASKIDKLVIYMKANNLPDSIISNRLAERWHRIRTNPKGLRETGFGETSAAYTVNKGDQLRICVRDEKSDNLFEDENTMVFVMLHELAHLMSKSYGHNLEFKKNFSYIAKIAVEIGVYKYEDFNKNPQTYCGTDITNSAF